MTPAGVEAVARAVVTALAVGMAESALLAGVVVALGRMGRPSATTRHVLWWLVLAASAALPAVSVVTSLGRVEHVAPASSRALSRTPNVRSYPGGADVTVTMKTAPSSPSSTGGGFTREPGRVVGPSRAIADAIANAASRIDASPFVATAAVALWSLVAGAGLLHLAAGLVTLRRIKRDASPLDERIVRRLRRWRHSTRAGRAVVLCVSNAVDVPVAVGFRTPTILLPARVVEREAIADLDQIAMHEYAHLDRYDDWTNLAQRAIERIFWFDPVVLVAGRRIALEREIACDDWVIAQTGRAHRYATCLWNLVELARLPATPILAPGALRSPRQITVRIERLLDSQRNALPRLSPAGALVLGVVCIALVVVQAQRAPSIAFPDASPAGSSAMPAPRFPTTVRTAVPARPAVGLRIALVAPAATSPASSKAPADDGIDAGLRDRIRRDVDRTMRGFARLPMPLVPPVTPLPPIAHAYRGSPAGQLDRAILADCAGCDLRGRDLRGLDLHGLTLTGVDLRDANLRGVDLHDASLMGVSLVRARLDGVDARDLRCTGCDVRSASFAQARLDGASFVGSNLRGANFTGTRLRSIVAACDGCDLRGADLHEQDFSNLRLAGIDLRGADLRGANLGGIRLEGVDLRGAAVDGANLRGAILHACDVRGVDFARADTHGASIDARASYAPAGLREALESETGGPRGPIDLQATVERAMREARATFDANERAERPTP